MGAYVIVSSMVQFTSVSVQSSQTGININQMNDGEWQYYQAAPLTQLPAGNVETMSAYGVGIVLKSDGYFSNVGLKMDLTYNGPSNTPADAISLQYKVGATGIWTALPMVWTESGDGTYYTGTYDIPVCETMEPNSETYTLVKIMYNAPGTWDYSFTAFADEQ